ncbi:MAG TPA: hypothetical protein PK185_07735 [Cyclobacteriaceae bacterium]|nr:hypothetical protein [Cyclobacteriaceae bacterium]
MKKLKIFVAMIFTFALSIFGTTIKSYANRDFNGLFCDYEAQICLDTVCVGPGCDVK